MNMQYTGHKHKIKEALYKIVNMFNKHQTSNIKLQECMNWIESLTFVII